MEISVVLCTYNRSEGLQKVLSNLARLTLPECSSCEVIVVDNNSMDDTKAVVEEFSRTRPGFFKYVLESRQGKSFALNTGIGLAKGKIIAFTDDDVELDRDWLVEITKAFESFDCIGIGGKIIAVWNCQKPRWYVESGPYKLMEAIVRLDLGEQPLELGKPVWGANMAFRRTVFEKYGLFRGDLGPNSENSIRGEDSEFCWRLLRGGEKVMYAPKVVVYHPVEEKRTKKNYFKSWYFDYGRALVRTGDIPEQAICYFGVPRYLFRQYVEASAKWLCCLNPRGRFYYKLQACLARGAIVESRGRPKLAKL